MNGQGWLIVVQRYAHVFVIITLQLCIAYLVIVKISFSKTPPNQGEIDCVMCYNLTKLSQQIFCRICGYIIFVNNWNLGCPSFLNAT